MAENGWFPWYDDDLMRDSCNRRLCQQNHDYSNLRLVSREMKSIMDAPSNGGPNFKKIVNFLLTKNGFHEKEGFCEYCFSEHGIGCDTCAGDNYESCNCTKSHRHGSALRQLCTRLDPNINIRSLSPRQRSTLLLRFLCKVASNFQQWYYKISYDTIVPVPDLTMIQTDMYYDKEDDFIRDMKDYNEPFFNFIHHLLFTGWADNDCYTSPGSCSPYRGRLLGDGKDYNDWNGGHRELFHEMFECFMTLHKSDEQKTVPPRIMMRSSLDHQYTLSQIQFIPETIRRIVMNCTDKDAEALLGKNIAESIDIYRLVRDTYDKRKGNNLRAIQWMPCLGVAREDFVPLETFEGYNPHHERFGRVANNIDGTGLTWDIDEDDEE